MHRQRGSVLTVIVVAVLIALGFWQRERLARWAPGVGAKNAAPVLEVTAFDCTPPGLLGVGTGVPLGNVFIGPFLAPAPVARKKTLPRGTQLCWRLT